MGAGLRKDQNVWHGAVASGGGDRCCHNVGVVGQAPPSVQLQNVQAGHICSAPNPLGGRREPQAAPGAVGGSGRLPLLTG